jgi:CubicO group peptidase (beta-lactamase class C family)
MTRRGLNSSRLAISAVSLALGATGIAACQSTPDTPDAAEIALETLQEMTGVPGMALAVVAADGRELHAEAGIVDLQAGTAVEPRTRFRIGSISKPVTAVLVGREIDAGRLQLDQPIELYLPDLPASLRQLTLRQLLTHTSGLPHYGVERATLGQEHYDRSRDAFSLFQDRAGNSEPGAEYIYSSYGYTVIAAVLETVTNTPFPEQVAAGFPRDDGPRADWGTYRLTGNLFEFSQGRPQAVPPHDYSYTWSGGGLTASALGLARFGQNFAAGDLVSASTLTEMTTPGRVADGSLIETSGSRIGLGWRLSESPWGERVWHHSGLSPGGRSALIVFPDSGRSVALLTNSAWTSAIETTAMTLARASDSIPALEPFADCSLFEGEVTIGFEEETASARSRAMQSGEICSVGLAVRGRLQTWFNGFDQSDTDHMVLLVRGQIGDEIEAMLVTPVGVFPVAGMLDGVIEATIGSREIVIHIRQA